jgi:phosphoribosyl 1,2-cyclic phosphodiesterase
MRVKIAAVGQVGANFTPFVRACGLGVGGWELGVGSWELGVADRISDKSRHHAPRTAIIRPTRGGAVKLRFWGVRGSVPWTIPTAIGHGCNTPCLQIEDEQSGDTLIIDAGSGIVGLGPTIAGPPRELPILLSHYHWDHLQGLPFLTQLYAPGWRPRVYGPELGPSHADWMDTLFRSPFFPVPPGRLPNRPTVDMIRAGALTIGGFELSAVALNHPGGALAFRVRGVTGDVVYATDHEFGNPAFDEPLAQFSDGAAVLILDAHFTPEEYADHRGWGHSNWRQCAEFAARVHAGGLWLFHHKPGRTDEALVRIRSDAQRIFRATETASEGEALQI